MGGLSRWAVRKPGWAILAFLVMAFVIGFLGTAKKGTLNDSFSLPDTESKTATDLLSQVKGSAAESANALTATVIWKPASGSAVDAATAAQVAPMLKGFSTLDGVGCVSNPFATAAAADVTQAQIAAGTAAAKAKALGAAAQAAAAQGGAAAAAAQAAATQAAADAQAAGAALKAVQTKAAAAGPTSWGTACPKQNQTQPDTSTMTPAELAAYQAAGVAALKATSPVSPDGTVAKSTITFTDKGGNVPVETAKTIINDVKALNGKNGLQVGASGQVLAFAGQEPPSSEGIGVTIALIILLIAFGSLIVAGLPLLTAGVGVGLGGLLLYFVANFYDVATFAPTLASMIGLGVGIDYSLFVINRYRQAIHAGHDPKRAALEAVNTSGRAVVFAATTVIIALLGLWIMRISFFNGLSLAASGTVLLVMLSAVWLLPALLSLLGNHAVEPLSGVISKSWAAGGRKRGILLAVLGVVWLLVSVGSLTNANASTGQRIGTPLIGLVAIALLIAIAPHFFKITREHRHEREPWHAEGGHFASYARLLQRIPVVPALLSLGLVLLLALPALSLRLGFPDDSGTAPGSPSRIAYDLQTEGFGAGTNGPFLVAVELPKAGDVAGYTAMVKALSETPGVASTTPGLAWIPAYAPQLKGQTVSVIVVTPTTGPQDEATTELLTTLRNDTIPPVTAATGVKGYVGGTTAITADFSTVMANALPLFLSVVVGLGFIMLLILFRAPLVSLTAVVTSLLSFAASLGITVAVFQWGWLNGILGVTGTGPIFPFLPVMVFAILFGLSMDYQVFLVSRMQEEWARGVDNSAAVRRGLAGSGRVVLMAALIMASVFGAFIPTPNNTIKLFGVALASAVLVDAFLIRLVFVPSFMSILGKANWWLPGWLDRILPHFELEAGADEIADDQSEPTAEPEREPVGS
jgi:putative drug exporter of the RND superfamily